MTRVLVTGAAGFIGRHVVAHLLERTDWDVVALTRGPFPGRRDRVEWWNVELPRTASVGLARWGVFGNVDYVINLASNADAARSLRDPVGDVDNNVGSCQALLEWARTLPGLKRFIQVSSAEVYGTAPAPFTEESPVRSRTPYAASKAAQDALAYAYREAYGLPVVVSATANVFGEGQPPTKLLPTLVRQMREGRDEIHVIPGCRRFVHAEDCASGWLWLLEHAPAEWSHCHVAGQLALSHAEFASAVAKAAAWGGRVVEGGEGRPGQRGDVLLDGSRMAEAGWRHPLGLEAGVARSVGALVAEARGVA